MHKCRYIDTHSSDVSLKGVFHALATDVGKLAAEARDNVKFLTTLERHFKAITYGPLSGVPQRLFLLSVAVCKTCNLCRP